MVLLRAGPSRVSLAVFFPVCPAQLVNMPAPHMAFSAGATALPRIQEFDVGLIYHVRLTPACSPMAVLFSACRSSDAVQMVFSATARLRPQLRVRRSSGQQGRPSPSDLYQRFVRDLAHRPSDQYACANTSSPTDRGPIVVSCDVCRRHTAVQRMFIEEVGLCWQQFQQLPSSKNGGARKTSRTLSPATSRRDHSRRLRALWSLPSYVSSSTKTRPLCDGSTTDDFPERAMGQ